MIKPKWINIIGAGNLGKTLGRLLVNHKLATIRGVVNQSLDSAEKSIQWMGDGCAFADSASLPPADLVFITTPDDAIVDTCLALQKNKSILPGSVVVHCSGSLSSDVLLPMKTLGCHVASIHPMRCFADPTFSVTAFPGTFCAYEGDLDATDLIIPLFQALGAVTYPIEKDKKALYHTAGVFASNYLVTLSHQAVSCLIDTGLDREMAMKVIVNIMKSTTLNLEKTLSPERALTGPIQRGDVATISNHLTALEDLHQKDLYTALGKATLALTSHDEKTLLALHKVFS
ncbi:MAG: DUF2520 domain-containing protein [Legionellales bacterium]|nr:DUF2520 domain-containing protein [Legionellales bacterium]